LNDSRLSGKLGEANTKIRNIESSIVNVQRELKDCGKYIESIEKRCDKMTDII